MANKQDYLELQKCYLNTLSPANIIQRRCQINKRVRIIMGMIIIKKPQSTRRKTYPSDTMCTTNWTRTGGQNRASVKRVQRLAVWTITRASDNHEWQLMRCGGKELWPFFKILPHSLPANVVKTAIYSVHHGCRLKLLCGTSRILSHSLSPSTEEFTTMGHLNTYGKCAPNFRLPKFTKTHLTRIYSNW